MKSITLFVNLNIRYYKICSPLLALEKNPR